MTARPSIGTGSGNAISRPVPHTAPQLSELAGIQHGFFGRQGGVSTGLYESLNCGPGSDDDAASIAENRSRAMAALGIESAGLITLYQTHSTDVALIGAPGQAGGDPPHADAAVTGDRHIALGILTADCAPVLFADAAAGVIGAAHAGWRGAFGGIIARTVTAMTKIGARPERIVAAIGPSIGPASYEVGDDFYRRFTAANADHANYFGPEHRPGHRRFDLPQFVVDQARAAGVGRVSVTGQDTLTEIDRYFSYRRNTLAGAGDYGRNLSVICLSEAAA